MSKTARKILDPLPGYNGHAAVFELSEPLKDGYCDDGEAFSLVIVSAADVIFSGPETYIFGAKRVGDSFEVANWSELPGSFRGGLSHTAALENAGYEVIA